MSKKLQITIVISTIAVILLLIGLFSLRQMHGTELPMDEDDSLALLEKLEGQDIFDADKYIFSDTVKDESSKRTSVIVHSTDYSDKTEGEFDAEAIKAMVVSFGKTFLSEVVEKKTFENLNATEVFSFSVTSGYSSTLASRYRQISELGMHMGAQASCSTKTKYSKALRFILTRTMVTEF